VRYSDWLLITPSGIRYDALEPTQIVEMDMEGTTEGRVRPSSEWRFHLDIYNARPEVDATFGTQLLSDYVLRALEDRTACLLANHGMVAVGTTLERASQLAIEVEMLCQMYLATLSAGEPFLLTDEEMQEVLDKFEDYKNPPARKPWE